MLISQPSWIDAGFVLANWEVRPRHGTLLLRDRPPSEPIRIEPRVMAVLTCLARHAGEVVTRDEFSAEVWGGRVVSDEALSRCISLLRQVLGDDSREPKFIRTIARIGYALVPTPMPLAPVGADTAPAHLVQRSSTPPAATNGGATTATAPPRIYRWPLLAKRRVRRQILLAVGCIGLLVAIALIYRAREMRSGADTP